MHGFQRLLKSKDHGCALQEKQTSLQFHLANRNLKAILGQFCLFIYLFSDTSYFLTSSSRKRLTFHDVLLKSNWKISDSGCWWVLVFFLFSENIECLTVHGE